MCVIVLYAVKNLNNSSLSDSTFQYTADFIKLINNAVFPFLCSTEMFAVKLFSRKCYIVCFQ